MSKLQLSYQRPKVTSKKPGGDQFFLKTGQNLHIFKVAKNSYQRNYPFKTSLLKDINLVLRDKPPALQDI